MTHQSIAPQDQQQQKPDPSWLLPWNWPVGIRWMSLAVVVMTLPFGIRAYLLNGVPVMDEPFDVAEFAKWDVPPEENAFADYRLAVQMQSQNQPFNTTAVYTSGWATADEPVRQYLESHREALNVWKRGTLKHQGRHLSPDQLDCNTSLNTVQHMRTFANLAMLEEARCIHDGQLDEAWQWARAAYRSGGHTTYRGGIIQGLIGVAIHEISTAGMARWAQQPDVTAAQLKAALAEMKSDYALYEPQSNLLKGEYLDEHNSLTSPNWLETEDIAGTPNGFINLASPTLAPVVKMGYWAVGEPELTFRILRQVFVNQIQELDKPLPARRKQVNSGRLILFDLDPAAPLARGQLNPAGIDRAIKQSVLADRVIFSMDAATLRQKANQAAIEVLLTTEAYRRDRGDLPEKLSQLVPDYLEAVPEDPRNPAGGPLPYHRYNKAKAVRPE